MRCLYEVLGLAQDADEAAIRSAYRKLALKWHPDKNQDNLAHAEEVFKEVQNAYEILSDPHERSWYDSHRDAILRSGERHQAGGGASGFAGEQRPADDIDLYTYFTSACYSGFGDGPRGFYAVFDDLFAKLAAQEEAAQARRAERGGRRAADTPMPRFGCSTSDWANVSSFYGQWGGFSTAKDFSWADQYNPASAPNRMVRRRMEQENEKARRTARREYNEQVRELVAFLRKRDKRVAARQVEEARLREEREQAEKERREQERRERLARAQAYEEAAWVRGDESGSGSESNEEGEEEQLLWYCMACEKHFKSQAALDNHERSKKHLEAVELLRAALQEDEALLGGEEGQGGDEDGDPQQAQQQRRAGAAAAASEEDESELEEEESEGSEGEEASSNGRDSEAESTEEEGCQPCVNGSAAGAAVKSSSGRSSSESEEEEESEVDEDDMLARLLASQQRGTPQQADSSDSEGAEAEVQKLISSVEEQEEGEEEEADGSDDALLQRMMAAQQQAAPRPAVQAATQALGTARLSDVEGSGSDSDWGQQARGKQRGKGRKHQAAKGSKGKHQEGPAQQEQQQQEQQQQQQPPLKAPSAKERRKQRQASRAGPHANPLACQVCRQEFPSRSKLFAHISATGHAAPKHL